MFNVFDVTLWTFNILYDKLLYVLIWVIESQFSISKHIQFNWSVYIFSWYFRHRKKIVYLVLLVGRILNNEFGFHRNPHQFLSGNFFSFELFHLIPEKCSFSLRLLFFKITYSIQEFSTHYLHISSWRVLFFPFVYSRSYHLLIHLTK